MQAAIGDPSITLALLIVTNRAHDKLEPLREEEASAHLHGLGRVVSDDSSPMMLAQNSRKSVSNVCSRTLFG